jgi:hypothetical protein
MPAAPSLEAAPSQEAAANPSKRQCREADTELRQFFRSWAWKREHRQALNTLLATPATGCSCAQLAPDLHYTCMTVAARCSRTSHLASGLFVSSNQPALLAVWLSPHTWGHGHHASAACTQAAEMCCAGTHLNKHIGHATTCRPDRDRFQRPYKHPMVVDGQPTTLTVHQKKFAAEGFASTGGHRHSPPAPLISRGPCSALFYFAQSKGAAEH